MKISITILAALFLTIGFKAMGQDVIIKNDKTEINSKVIELTDDVIKYRKFEMLDGPIYSIKKSEVFMIVYKNGMKEYIESKPKVVKSDTVVVATNVQPIQEPLMDINSKHKQVRMISLGTTTSFSVEDIEMFFPLGHNFYWGGSIYGTPFIPAYTYNPSTFGIYPFVAYKLPLSNTGFNIWANVGYDFSTTSTYFIGPTTIPASYSSGFLWEVGVDYFFLKNLGVTLYSPTLSGLFFGIVLRN